MKTNNTNKEFTGIDIPESVTDPEERELFEHLEKAMAIIARKKLPFLCLTAYSDLSKALLAAAGCKHCLVKLVKNLLDKEPHLFGVFLEGTMAHLAEVKLEEINAVKSALKQTPQGN